MQDAIAMSLNGDEVGRLMATGGRDLRTGMTKTEQEAFIKGVARLVWLRTTP